MFVTKASNAAAATLAACVVVSWVLSSAAPATVAGQTPARTPDRPKSPAGETSKWPGEWLMEGNTDQPCAVFQHGRVLLLVNERGEFATGRLTEVTKVAVRGWEEGLVGELSDEGKTIAWGNGTKWKRPSISSREGPSKPQLPESALPQAVDRNNSNDLVRRVERLERGLQQVQGTSFAHHTTGAFTNEIQTNNDNFQPMPDMLLKFSTTPRADGKKRTGLVLFQVGSVDATAKNDRSDARAAFVLKVDGKAVAETHLEFQNAHSENTLGSRDGALVWLWKDIPDGEHVVGVEWHNSGAEVRACRFGSSRSLVIVELP
jgi:hypothetical protein